MILPLREHPVALKLAEAMACEHKSADPMPMYTAFVFSAQNNLQIFLTQILDLSIPATRDRWVRWGVDTWRARTRNEYFDANVPFKWHTLRDNPQGLHDAILKEIAAGAR